MLEEILYGYCHCGCNQKTKIAQRTYNTLGIKKGVPNKFIIGHGNRNKKSFLKGLKVGETIASDGYVLVYSPNHPNKDKNNRVRRSHLVVEKVLGKILPVGIIIHHFDENKLNDIPKNFVVCENRSYHLFLHQRQRALKKCGNVHWRKCPFCKQYDDPKNMVNHSNGFAHRECKSKYQQEYKKIKGGKSD